MNVAGQVIWSTVLSSDEGGARLGVGIHFTEISEDNLKFLRQVLEQSEEKQS
jgi:Tfp pilus assembly protein PilZ